MKRAVLGLLSFALICTAWAADNAKVRIVLVGDSTVTDHAGWGLGFRQFIDPARVELINTAQGGRSSMSFMKEGRWEQALALKGDYYLIQFGHNDEPGKPGRSTTLEEYRANMIRYVGEARKAGATPVLVTSLVRRQFDSKNDHLIRSSLESHVAIVREIATAKNVPLIDLHAESKAICEKLGRDGCLTFSPRKSGEGKPGVDHTHLNENGYVLFGRVVAMGLRSAVPALAPVLRDTPLNAHPQAEEAKADAIVSADGSGTHTTVQAAINAAPDGGGKPFTILVKPGTYAGQVIVPVGKKKIRLIGEEAQGTVMTYGLNVNEADPQGSAAFKGTGFVVLADDFRAENITFQNTSGDHGQALALRVDSDRAIFKKCRALGWQDTVMLNRGRDYFVDCYIEGRVDFIYGSATAVFENCEIHSKNGGHVTAANTPQDHPFGFVFLHCRLTGDPEPWDPAKKSAKKPMADLGRPWRPYAHVAYIGCEMDAHIKPEGWNNWGKPENEKTARYFEYRNTGPGANPSARVPWSKQLTDEEVKQYTLPAILGGSDQWQPQAEVAM
jgi:pectinesterase